MNIIVGLDSPSQHSLTITCHRLVHIPGQGDFQVERILTAIEPLKGSWSRKDEEMFEEKVVDEATEERQVTT